MLVAVCFGSCSDWLAVTPFDALEKEKIYENERNTNSALNGLYLTLSGSNLYGKELSMGMLEVLAQNFTVPSGSGSDENPYYHMSQYNYGSKIPKASLSSIFSAGYKAIAGCNEFIESVTDNKSNYSEERYNFYMGEAIGIRTVLHFDMMRLFGPVGTELDRQSVPYYDISTDAPQPILTANQMLDKLMADMDTAIAYLKNDPILRDGLQADYDNATNTDFFDSFRNIRMNYYGAWAIKARICLYKNTEQSRAEAYKIASSLLNGTDPADPSKTTNFKKEFAFVEKGTNQVYFKVYFPEVLLGLHNINRGNMHKNLFSGDLANDRILSGGPKFWDRLYSTGAAGNDGNGTGIRRDMWTYDGIKDAYLFNRFSGDGSNPWYPYHNQFQSIMRLGELYLIAAETAPDTETKRGWLEKLRNNRGYDPGNANGLNDQQLNTLLEFEFRKETYGEGQYFFFAKRKNLTQVYNQTNAVTKMDRSKYVPPLPQNETDYRKEDVES